MSCPVFPFPSVLPSRLTSVSNKLVRMWQGSLVLCVSWKAGAVLHLEQGLL